MMAVLTAEFVGTFVLVFAGTGAIVVDSITGSLTHAGVALTFGLVVMVLVYSLGGISGAHLNPAVTIALAVRGVFALRRVPGYIAAQLAGAVAASAAVRAIFGNVAGLGATVPATGAPASFLLEVVLTFVLMYVILGTAVDHRAPRGVAGAAIGAAVGLDAMFGGPISGASMNPARSFGPALVAGVFNDHWVYWAGPIAGVLVAVFVSAATHGLPRTVATGAEPSKQF